MSRLIILLVVVAALLIGGVVVLAKTHGEKPQLRVEKAVTLESLSK